VLCGPGEKSPRTQFGRKTVINAQRPSNSAQGLIRAVSRVMRSLASLGGQSGRAKARRGFGVGLDDDPRAGVFLLWAKTSFQKPRPVRPPTPPTERPREFWSITSTYPGSGAGWVWVKAAVFGQMTLRYPVMQPRARAAELYHRAVRVRMSSTVRGLFRVKMANPLWFTITPWALAPAPAGNSDRSNASSNAHHSRIHASATASPR